MDTLKQASMIFCVVTVIAAVLDSLGCVIPWPVWSILAFVWTFSKGVSNGEDEEAAGWIGPRA